MRTQADYDLRRRKALALGEAFARISGEIDPTFAEQLRSIEEGKSARSDSHVDAAEITRRIFKRGVLLVGYDLLEAAELAEQSVE